MLLYSQPLVSKGHWVQDPCGFQNRGIPSPSCTTAWVQITLGIHQFSIQRYGGPTVIMVINTLTGNPWECRASQSLWAMLGWAVEWILDVGPIPLQIWSPPKPNGMCGLGPVSLLLLILPGKHRDPSHCCYCTSGQQLVTKSQFIRRELVLLSQMSQNSCPSPSITCTHSMDDTQHNF